MIVFLHFARRYLRRYLPWYAGGTVALAVTNWLSVTIPLYLAEGIDALALGPGGRPIILRSAAIVAAMGVTVIVTRTASRLLFFTPGRLVEAEVKGDLFARMLQHQPTFLAQWPTGDLISRNSSDTNLIRLVGGFIALGVVNTTVALVLTGTQMVRISPTLAAWVLVPLACGMVVTILTVRGLHSLMRRLQAQAASISDHALSSYQGMATLRAFGAGPAFAAAFSQRNQAYLRTTLRLANLRTVIGPILALAAAVNVFLLLYVGGPLAIAGEVTVGELVAFTTLVAYLTGPLRGLSFIVALVKQAQASIERIDAVLLPEPDRPELPDAVQPSLHAPAVVIDRLRFAYPDTPDQTVLHDISLEVPAGGTLGLLGPTGSGKTTLLRCIARLYNPPPGTVRVDGEDVLRLDLDTWRERIAMVPQRAFLFTESVRDNILLGAPDDGRLEEAIRQAALEVDLEALPNGLDTLVGEAGLTLSGGQRQRVALARGLVRSHTVLLLDDVLSAVDHGTEQQLLAALRNLENRPTTVIVANRISAIQHADVIAVLDHGRLADLGTHETLIARPGLYRETWEHQREGEDG